MALNLRKITVNYLKSNQDRKFTARQIAEWVFENYTDECRRKKERSKAKVIPIDTDDALIGQLVAEITAKRKQLEKYNIKATGDKPRCYFYSEETDEDEIAIVERISESPKLQENQLEEELWDEESLYEKLASYLKSELSVFSKRIDEKSSSNTGGKNANRWRYPDIVGIQDLSADWEDEIKECVEYRSDKKIRLWSFEVKKLINSSNVREAFFQTVSNSSWANLSYLVAAEYRENIMKELQILCSLHGIGFILLDRKEPVEKSKILIQALDRTDIDWDSANELAKQNKDFSKFIKLINKFYRRGDDDDRIDEGDWL